MGIALPLDKRTTSEKLSERERWWEDLCRNPENVLSPSWHETVLAEREKQVSQGKMSFIDWDEAKERIRKATS
jgi:hypothetical protein